jgi:SAM-dependent MidA family methyltransferase
MSADCRALISDRIRQSGPITVAEFMDLALYAPGVGYYARATQRSGRTGDFYTSVDVGSLFGTLLAEAFADMFARVREAAVPDAGVLDLVEAGAGNGRLSRDVLDALGPRHPSLYAGLRLTLVERSADARAAQPATLAGHAARVAGSGPDLPASIEGVLFANELLDALPVHVVQMTREGLGEIYVGLDGDALVERLAPPSTPALAAHLDAAGVALAPGQRGEINLAALDWVRTAAARLRRGFLVLVDYGDEAAALYSPARPMGTLASFSRHMIDAPAASRGTPPWLSDPGSRDLTSHVDFTSIRREAERAGLFTAGRVTQSAFLLNLALRGGILAEVQAPDRLRERLALKTLLGPGGLGTTHSVMIFGTQVDTADVAGLSGAPPAGWM